MTASVARLPPNSGVNDCDADFGVDIAVAAATGAAGVSTGEIAHDIESGCMVSAASIDTDERILRVARDLQ